MVSAGANCGSNLSQNEVYEFEAYCSSTNYQYTENLIDFGSTESGLLSNKDSNLKWDTIIDDCSSGANCSSSILNSPNIHHTDTPRNENSGEFHNLTASPLACSVDNLLPIMTPVTDHCYGNNSVSPNMSITNNNQPIDLESPFFDPTPIMTSMEQSQFSQINEHYGNNRISNVNETIECNNVTRTNSKSDFSEISSDVNDHETDENTSLSASEMLKTSIDLFKTTDFSPESVKELQRNDSVYDPSLTILMEIVYRNCRKKKEDL
jgi:hypothetical protein